MGTSARTIAKAVGCNSALIFYHFNGVDPLLLAALDRSSEERMAAHREAVTGAKTIEDLAEVATTIYRSDIEGTDGVENGPIRFGVRRCLGTPPSA